MRISFIVATSKNGVIGKDKAIPWYLPADFAYFKETTMGHPIIMGRKTYESIGRTLPGRLNIVMTKDSAYHPEGTRVASSIDEALKLANDTGDDEVFIIGGGAIYDAAMDKVERIYLTVVNTEIEDGDTFFKFSPEGWKQMSLEHHAADEANKFDYDFMVLERTKGL